MEKGFISVVKVKYVFKDGKEMVGIELNLAPKVKKFISMSRDNRELMELMGNGLAEWFTRAEFGDDIMLTCSTSKDKIVVPVQ